MTKEEKYKKAMAFIDENKMSHISEPYWGDQVYTNLIQVVSVNDAKLAIEIALGKA